MVYLSKVRRLTVANHELSNLIDELKLHWGSLNDLNTRSVQIAIRHLELAVAEIHDQIKTLEDS
jgi:hypothetical protein